MFSNIVSSPLQIPNSLSPDAQDLLKKLLCKNQKERIGFKEGIKEIKTHRFCKSIDFHLLKQKKIPPPFTPDINESYFDNDYLSKHLEQNPDINLSALGHATKVHVPKD